MGVFFLLNHLLTLQITTHNTLSTAQSTVVFFILRITLLSISQAVILLKTLAVLVALLLLTNIVHSI